MSQFLYHCDGCHKPILPKKARIHCEECVGNHNVCANCYVVAIFTQRHEEKHSTSLVEISGYQERPPPIPPRRPAAQQLPGPPPLTQQTQQISLPPPPGQPPIAWQPNAPFPSVAPGPVANQITIKSGWQPLFLGSGPTSTMVAFLEAVFARLDTDRDGLLTPEQYSAFLDVQGYGPEEDVWKKHHKDLPGYTADDVADFELKTSYENFSIQHKMQTRPNAITSTYMDDMIDSMKLNASFANLMKATTERRTFSRGLMPMLALSGFIDITTIETLCDPSPGWIRVNRIAQHYNIWREWGDVPRSMMPEVPPQELMARIEVITSQSAIRAQTLINAGAAEAAIKAQGRENALRLLDPPGTRYVYRY